MTNKSIPKRRQSQKVRFAQNGNNNENSNERNPKCSIIFHPPLFTALWYQRAEISAFKSDARNVILLGATRGDVCFEEELSGLERFNLQRSLGKKAAIQYVLLAQKKNKGPEFIRLVYEKCNAWAMEFAVDQGFKDFCQVYDPLESLLGSSCENYNDCLFTESKKRKHNNCEQKDPIAWVEEGRRVRQKTMEQFHAPIAI